jgi:hypothetical protein
MSHAYTTTNTRKRKNKLTSGKYSQYCMDWIEHKKDCKRLGIKAKTMDEYIAYRQGNYKPTLRGVAAPKLYVSDHREKYPSQSGIGVTFARKENTYTGTLIKGIATMHKSNAVPVINQEQAEEISRMRRG